MRLQGELGVMGKGAFGRNERGMRRVGVDGG